MELKTLFRTIFGSVLILLLSLLAVTEASAQDNTLRQANEAFNRFEYRNAIDLYLLVLKKDRNNLIALENIAECYRLTGDTRRAESAYKKAANANSGKTFLFFRYGQMLMANQKYEEAKKVFEHYKKLEPTDNRGYVFAESCKNIDILRRDSSGYQIKTLPFNTDYSEFSPTIYDKGLVFASSRPGSLLEQKDGWTGEAYLDLYYTQKDGDKWSEPVALPGKTSISAHEGPAVFNRYGTLMYFTRSATKAEMKKTGTATLKIFQAKRGSTGWMDTEALPFNKEGYSMGQPAISPDAKTLYFTADLPGGMGGKDLYFSKLVNGKWTEPQNMGESINTRGDEMFPTVQNDGILYYSSDGLGGLGGLDIYRVNVGAGGGFTVENVGYPINSSKDDFGLIYLTDYRTAYLSSNRYNGKGDDILEVAISPLKAGKLIKEQPLLINDFEADKPVSDVPVREVRQNDTAESTTNIYKEEKVADDTSSNDNLPAISDGEAVRIALKGKLLDKTTSLPIKNQTVELTDQTSGKNYRFTTNHDGSFTFIVPKNNVHKLRSFTASGKEAQVLSLNFINTSLNDMPAEILLFGELPEQQIKELPKNDEEKVTEIPEFGQGGVTYEHNTAVKSETGNKVPIDVPTPDAQLTFTFKVQISSFDRKTRRIDYGYFKKLPIPYIKETTDRVRFMSGNFTTLAEAEAYRNQLHTIPPYTDAFVAVYINGKRSPQKLEELEKQYNLRGEELNKDKD